MSGIIPDSILSVDIDGFDENGSNEFYCMVSFPEKVIVNSVKVTVNGEARATGATWTLSAVKGRKSPGAESPYSEDIVPFFGENEKPTVVCSEGHFVSDVVMPVERYGWWTTGEAYDGNVAQMDPDEYLMLFLSSEEGDFEEFDATKAKATIVLGYTGASPNL